MKRYLGIRHPSGRRWVVVEDLERQTRQPLRHRRRHSPDGFEWSYGGSGPADLARSILWDHLGAEPTMRAYQSFKRSYVAKFDRAGWELDGEAIGWWVMGWRLAHPGAFLTVAEEDGFWALDPEFGGHMPRLAT